MCVASDDSNGQPLRLEWLKGSLEGLLGVLARSWVLLLGSGVYPEKVGVSGRVLQLDAMPTMVGCRPLLPMDVSAGMEMDGGEYSGIKQQ